MYRKFKPRKYKIYFRVSKFIPSRFTTKSWKSTRRRLEWFKRRGIKAYAKRY